MILESIEIDNKSIDLIKRGDQKAFEVLYNSYSDKVFNTILSYLQNKEEAEEVLQDVFVKIFHSAKDYRGEASVSTWIYRIAVNKSLDFLRKKRTLKRSTSFVSLFSASNNKALNDHTDFRHPGIVVESEENAKILFAVIDLLPEKQKTVFILTQIEQLTQDQVGEIMNTTRKAIESLLSRAKANLRKKLEKLYPERGIKPHNTSK